MQELLRQKTTKALLMMLIAIMIVVMMDGLNIESIFNLQQDVYRRWCSPSLQIVVALLAVSSKM